MRTVFLVSCALLFLLPACMLRPPPIPYAEVPAGPLIDAMDQHRRSVASLRALARVTSERDGKHRVYESVAILERDYERLRLEGYGPLGERLFALLWNGAKIMVTSTDGSGVRMLDSGSLERIIGIRIAPEELCAMLTGSAPLLPTGDPFAAGCSSDGRCAIDVPAGDLMWRMHLLRTGLDAGRGFRIVAVERYRGGSLELMFDYAWGGQVGPSAVPERVTARYPSRKASLAIELLDAEVNAFLPEDQFQLSPDEGVGR